MALNYEDRASLPSTTVLSEKPQYTKVEHTSSGSFADNTDLLDPIKRQSFNPDLQTHEIKKTLDCEATHSGGMGHSGPATHFVQLEGEAEHQQTPVCATHLGKIIENSISRGETGVSQRRIHPEDVRKFAAWRGIQEREKRTYLEGELVKKGMTGEDALVGRVNEDLGKGGGTRTTHLEEVKSRRTPAEQASTLERQLERVRTGGGHNTSDNTASEEAPTAPSNTPTEYKFNKKGVPNSRGGRKNKPKGPGDSEDLPLGQGSGLADKVYNQLQAKRRGEPFEKVSMSDGQKNEVLEAIKSRAERKAAGIPEGGVKPRGFSKTATRRIEVTLTGLEKEAPEVGIIERFAAGRQARQDKQSTAELSMNTEAERLRSIEANKNASREARSAAFEVGKNPNL
jgi:hypothetical protein